MIDPKAIDLSALPWLPLDARSAFPRQPAIYFAIDNQGSIQYIGRSVDPGVRWKNHHRYDDLDLIGGVKIVYLFVDSPKLLPEIESALIAWFNPPLNREYKPEAPKIPPQLSHAVWIGEAISIVEVRNKLRQTRIRVRAGEVIPVYQYLDLIGYLTPPNRVTSKSLLTVRNLQLKDFRVQLTDLARLLLSDNLDCVYVRFHSRVVMAFVRKDIWQAIDEN